MVKVNTKKLYRADGYAIQEVLRVVSLLYHAQRRQRDPQADEVRSVTASTFDISKRANELKAVRALASEITARGADLHALLGEEASLREERLAAVNQSLDLDQIERSVHTSIAAVNAQIQQTLAKMGNLAADEASLEAKLDKKKLELERNEKRLKSLQSVRPAYLDEYERLEEELKRSYEIYIEKFRNLSALESQLEDYHRAEQEQFEETEESLRRMQARMRHEELRLLQGDNLDGLMDDTRPAALETTSRRPLVTGNLVGEGNSAESSLLSDDDLALSSSGGGRREANGSAPSDRRGNLHSTNLDDTDGSSEDEDDNDDAFDDGELGLSDAHTRGLRPGDDAGLSDADDDDF